MRRITVSAIALLCCLGQIVVCTAAEPSVKTGEKRDTMIYVRTDPPGAKVLLNGKELGASNDMFLVEPGVGKVVIELEGYEKTEKQVAIRANGVTRLEVTLKQQAATNGGDATQLAQQGWQLWQGGKMNEAAAKFQQAVKLAPNDENAWNGLGWANLNSGKLPEAQKAFERLLVLNPKHAAALNGLGQLFLAQKKYDLAETNLLKAAPEAPAAWYGLARLYLLQGKFEEAEKFAQRIEDSGQGDDIARRMLKAAKEKHLSDGLRAMIEPPAQFATSAEEQTASPQADKARTNAKVVEGIGWGGFRVGATRDELVKVFGPMEHSPGSQRMGWATRHHIDCWFDQAGRAIEVRFSKGFDLPLTSGIKIGSPEKDVLAAYGSPDRVVNNPQSKMLEYRKRGILMWIMDGKVLDFTVFKPKIPDGTESEAIVALMHQAEGGNYFAKYNLWTCYHNGLQGVAKNREKADKLLRELVENIHLAKFRPTNGFAPKDPGEFLANFSAHSTLRSGPMGKIGGASFFRTKNKDGMLIGSFLTEYPDKMRKAIADNPSLKLISIEKLTPEMFVAYEASQQESLDEPKTGYPSSEKQEVIIKAKKAAKAWLNLVDDGKYATSWDEAATLFKANVTKEQWETALKGIRAPLGAIKSRTLKSATFTKNLPGVPDGEYVVIQLKTRFDNDITMIETITPMREKDGAWKVSGYYIKPDVEKSSQDKSRNILKNSNIETGDKTPNDWKQGATIDGVSYLWDKNVAFEGKASLCIAKTANRYFPIAQWSQTVDREGDSSVLEVSAQVKAERMTKAILDVFFLDRDGQWISHKWIAYIGSKQNGGPPANHDWKEYSGKVAIPENTAQICIGLQVYGPGKVWFDDVQASYGATDPNKTIKKAATGVELSNDKFLDESQRLYRNWTEYRFSTLFDAASLLQMLSPEEKVEKEEQWIKQLSTPPEELNAIPAINQLAAIRSRNAVPGLLKIAADRQEKDNRGRWMAVRALGLIGDPAAVPELIDLVYHFNQNTRFWAQISLVRLTGKNFGRDAAAWKRWWREQDGKPAVSDNLVVWTSNQEWADPEKQMKSDRQFTEGQKEQLQLEQQGTKAVKPMGTIPKIVSMTPKNSAKDVDPTITELKVTFDVPMAGGYSWVGGGPNYPETPGKPHWTEDRKTCVLPVKLKPGWKYQLGLNSSSYKNFKSASGISLKPVPYRFTTGSNATEKKGSPAKRVILISTFIVLSAILVLFWVLVWRQQRRHKSDA